MKTDNTATKKESKPNQPRINRDEIAGRAYKLWCGANRPMGRDLEFRLEAEAELLAVGRGRSPELGAAWPNEGHKSGEQGQRKQKTPSATAQSGKTEWRRA